MEGLLAAFSNGSYAPHGYCLLWQPGLIWTHVIADAVIALSYFSIPVVLVALIRRRRDIAFGWMFWCFATFILACGFTHVMAIWTLWQPVYGLEAVVKVVTACASLATAVLLWPLLPKIAALPAPGRLAAANAELAASIAERDVALKELREQVAQREDIEAALLQSQKLEAIGQLTGGIAHDFNNLLQAIAGNLELIARKPDDADRVVRWSAGALDAVERGRTVTSQLLAFSTKQRLEVSSVRLTELLGGMRGLIERAVAPLGHLKVEPIDPSWNVVTDPLQLELAVLNLAFNARDAMPDGGTMTISASRKSGIVAPGLPAGDYVALTIADSGVGMSPDVAKRAVEPFFTTKGTGRGTGIGLSMAFGVARQSGGTLTIESAEGKGTAITLFLPLAATEPVRAVQDDSARDTRADLTGLRIALVDDDHHVRTTLADMLRTAGAEVEESHDGMTGVAMVQARRPHLLVVDFAMPGMSGADVAREVHAADPTLPVIVVTGYAESETLDSILGPKVKILRKPFESQQLLRCVAEMMDR